MFPFVFKLWRYQGFRLPDVPGVSPTPPVPPVEAAVTAREAEMDDIYARAALQKQWQERYLPRLWGSPHPRTVDGRRTFLAVDDGGDGFADVLKTAAFLAGRWEATLAESTVMESPDAVFQIATREGADWVIASPELTETLMQTTRLTVLADRGASLTGGVRRILVPVDGTTASLVAVAEGLRWAKTFDAELMVLHVAESAAEAATEHPEFLDVLRTVSWESTSHEIRTGEGDVADAILAAAEGADLIILITKTATTALEVLRRSPVAVLILHAEES